ncbi:DUF2975 domain-containing protein [Companilactobacillus sp. HBUAS56275]|uniref:DUF2975 domain-containing protein n=1 Tax=Candidatus Companilactobacillus pullicola TaxID=2838523 RepID=A0A9D1ZMP0_9LACO|nr:DUF2975 domain-containing protein [Candidatus Companilactobacillus pullicola]
MKKLSSLILKVLSILTVIAQVFCGIAAVSVIFANVAVFFVSGEAATELKKYVLQPTNLSKGMLELSGLNALLILVSIMFALYALRKIINNIAQNDFFVEANVVNMKLMMGSVGIFILGNVFSMIFFSYGNGRNLSSVFSNSWGQVGSYLILLAIIYMLYLVFKYGFELQHDSDTVI